MDHEHAVSQVVAVVLMVAVTAIIAGIVASLCLSIAQPLPETHSIGAKAERTGNTIAVTYYGGQDARKVHHLNWTIDGGEQTDWLTPQAGSTATGTAPAGTSCRVMVTATFHDRAGQIILDTTL
jgi:FlaG/FlaF family flagellin (archaellin)